jgi:hypothetical protein
MFEGTRSGLYLSDFSAFHTTVSVIYAVKDKTPGKVVGQTVFRFDNGNLVERRFLNMFELPNPNYMDPLHQRLGISNLLHCGSVEKESGVCWLAELCV